MILGFGASVLLLPEEQEPSDKMTRMKAGSEITPAFVLQKKESLFSIADLI